MKIPQKQMTFEQANERKSNPHFNESRQYRVNCQACVVSHELRMRGWNVEAIGNTKRRDSLARKLSYATQKAWIDRKINAEPAKLSAKDYDDFFKKAAEIGRYHIRWSWKGANSGHIITFERTSKTEGFFYDPQTGKKYSLEQIKKDWGNLVRENTVQYYRVDTLNVNPDFIKVVKKKPKERKKN